MVVVRDEVVVVGTAEAGEAHDSRGAVGVDKVLEKGEVGHRERAELEEGVPRSLLDSISEIIHSACSFARV